MPRGKKKSSSQRASTKSQVPPITRGSAKRGRGPVERGRGPTHTTVTLTPTVQNDDSDQPELITAESQGVSSPLTKDDIPTIVHAILEHLPIAQRPSSSMATDNSTPQRRRKAWQVSLIRCSILHTYGACVWVVWRSRPFYAAPS